MARQAPAPPAGPAASASGAAPRRRRRRDHEAIDIGEHVGLPASGGGEERRGARRLLRSADRAAHDRVGVALKPDNRRRRPRHDVLADETGMDLLAHADKSLNERGADFAPNRRPVCSSAPKVRISAGCRFFRANQTTEVSAKVWPAACRSCDGRNSFVAHSPVSWPAMAQAIPMNAKPSASGTRGSTKRRIVAMIGASRNCGMAIQTSAPPTSSARYP